MLNGDTLSIEMFGIQSLDEFSKFNFVPKNNFFSEFSKILTNSILAIGDSLMSDSHLIFQWLGMDKL